MCSHAIQIAILSCAMHGSMIFRRLGAAAEHPASRFKGHALTTSKACSTRALLEALVR